MSTKSGAGSAGLPLSLERQVNAACRRFEAAWHGGGRPRIEDYLADRPDPARPALLAELLALELAYRLRDGEAPAAEDYRARFPGDDTVIDEAFRTLAPSTVRPPPIPDEATVPEQAPRRAPGDGAAAGPPAVPGYEVLGRLGQGGMGDVWRGRDRRLRRDVAVKVMRAELAGWPQLARRFLEEAQVTSQLAHPAIPPVHELGELPGGRPYFVMKLVKGQTLADLLEARKGPADDRPRLLAVFEQVCQGVAYAHSKGVIHRDLKPSNVMVGAFGEVQVMDWGLAKVLAASPPEAAASGQPSRVMEPVRTGGADDATQAGSVLGTYAYMPPEQARGEVDRLDERGDVFGLGAILCELLTGQPPYVGTAEEVKAQAQLGHVEAARARLGRCGADEELVGLARRCLSARADERLGDAAAVAAALTAHLAGVQERLRRAELDRAAAQARAAEERKRRRVQLALAAAVLFVVAIGGGGAWWVQQERAARQQAAAGAVKFALEKAAGLCQQAHWREAAAVLEQARQVVGEAGPGDLGRRLEVAEAELALVSRLDTIRQRRATVAEGKFDKRTAERDYAAAFKEAGLGEVGDDEATVAARVRASGVSGPLVAALDDWAAVAQEQEARSWLLGVARLADPDPWRDSFRKPAVWGDRQALRALADDALRDDGARMDELSPQVLDSLGLRLGGGAEAVPLLRAAQRRYPNDFWLSLDLGNALRNVKPEEAVGYLRVAVALRPDASAAHNNLGNVLAATKDLEGAIDAYRKAIDIDPKFAPAHNNLGNVLAATKDLKGAIDAYRKAIDIDPKFAKAHYNLGLALRAKGDVDGAIDAYRKAIDCDRNYASAYFNLGHTLDAKGDVDGAIDAYRKAIDCDHDFPEAHCNLGLLLQKQGRFGEALRELRHGHALGSKRPDWRYPSPDWVRQCEHLAAQDEKLPAVLRGDAQPPSAADRAEMAFLCRRYKKLHFAATRLYAEAFAADPRVADNLTAWHRYNAASSAAVVAAGQADDARQLPDKALVMLRRQALGWLRADLALWAKMAERNEAAARQQVRQRLTDWQQEADLACVRDPEALARLPDDERPLWRQLWAEVAALVKKVEEKK
jgi:serine/threonine-protein kinase